MGPWGSNWRDGFWLQARQALTGLGVQPFARTGLLAPLAARLAGGGALPGELTRGGTTLALRRIRRGGGKNCRSRDWQRIPALGLNSGALVPITLSGLRCPERSSARGFASPGQFFPPAGFSPVRPPPLIF
jgi:hypothetical protein